MQKADEQYHVELHSRMLDSNPKTIFRQRVMLFRRIEKLAPNLAHARVLDAAAGSGYAGIFLARKFPECRVVALESSRIAANEVIPQMAEAHGVAQQIESVHGSFSGELNLGKFDVILCFGALHHAPNLQETFRVLSSSLESSGLLFAHEPFMPDTTTNLDFVRKYEAVENKFGRLITNQERDDHFYRRSEYICAAAHAGLDLREDRSISDWYLWSLKHARHLSMLNFARVQKKAFLTRFSSQGRKMKRQLPKSRYFAWSKSDAPWIPHVWT